MGFVPLLVMCVVRVEIALLLRPSMNKEKDHKLVTEVVMGCALLSSRYMVRIWTAALPSRRSVDTP